MSTFLDNKNKGFTLIELLVVIAIIGLLSSVVLASLSTARQKARVAATVSTFKNLETSLYMWADAKGCIPSDLVEASSSCSHGLGQTRLLNIFYDNNTFNLRDYLRTVPVYALNPKLGLYYDYDDNSLEPVNCSAGDSIDGWNVLTINDSSENYELLEKYLDNTSDNQMYSATARNCGKIQTTITATGGIGYVVYHLNDKQ